MAQDKAYKRDLKRAIQAHASVTNVQVLKTGHIAIDVTLPDRREITLTASGSPRDHGASIQDVVRTLKRYINGTY